MGQTIRNVIYFGSWIVLRSLFVIYFRYRVHGSEHIPRRGAFLVAANHASYGDPLFVGLGVPRPMYFLARHTLFRNPFFGWLIRLHNAVPVMREGVSAEAVKRVLDLLRAEKPFLIFPEGTRSADGEVGQFRAGVVRMAQQAQVLVVPCRVIGNHRAWGRGARLPRPTHVAVHFGAPLAFPEGEDPDLGLARLRERIRALGSVRSNGRELVPAG